MKEINTLLKLYKDSENQTAALATVINVEGSSYRRTGARMLIYENGTWKGGISGGCLEKDVLKNAKRVMLDQKAKVIRYDTNEDSSSNIGASLGCNGIIDILISPLKKGHPRNPLEVLKNCVDSRIHNLLITVLKNSTSLELTAGEMFHFQHKTNDFKQSELAACLSSKKLIAKVETDVETVLSKNRTQILDYDLENGGSFSLLFEILPPNIHLILVGNNYDVYPLAEMAHLLGCKISVIANPFKLDKSIYKIVKIYAAQKDRQISIDTDEHTAVILMSHDYGTDLANLKYFLPSKVAYIGVLGPRKRGEKLFHDLESENFEATEAQLARVFTPTGLDIGALSPEEIALSILAEIRAYFSGRDGKSLVKRKGPIHERV